MGHPIVKSLKELIRVTMKYLGNTLNMSVPVHAHAHSTFLPQFKLRVMVAHQKSL